MKKSIFKITVTIFVKPLSKIFFQKKYLKGRWFDDSLSGWVWVIKGIWFQKILGFNRKVKVPCHHTVTISNLNNIEIHPDDLNNLQSPGVYWQCFKGKIIIGKGSYIAPNVGLITANHNLENLDAHDEGKNIILGKKCWIGMNSVILPGVILGDNTIVAAGAVVTRSFPAGNQVLGGVPAKVIKNL